MVEVLQENALLLLFLVAAIGYSVGRISYKGRNLGVAAVLFVGLAFGAYNPEFKLPDIVFLLGLVVFVYVIGLTSGPMFFSNVKKSGTRDLVFITVMLTISAGIAVGLHYLFQFAPSTTSGLFAGSTTNTPALAGVLDYMRQTEETGVLLDDRLQKAVVGYSLSYPMGVFGVILAIAVMRSVLKIDFNKEKREIAQDFHIEEEAVSKSFLLANEALVGKSFRDIKNEFSLAVVFGRMKRNGEMSLSSWNTVLNLGDQVAVVGPQSQLDKIKNLFGAEIEEHLAEERSVYDFKRIFVSNPKVAGKTIASLNLEESFDVLVTRVRRGDSDILATNNTVLELGDRIRFVAKKSDHKKLQELFGDSYDAASSINLLSFGFGIALGLFIGSIALQLPGGITFNLGYAGGPLLVALVLGTLRRTGPIVWTLPYSVTVTLRQFGLTLLLAGIGVNSGHTLMETITGGGGGMIFLAGTIISFVSAAVTLYIGYKLVKIPFSLLLGMVSNQPAILDYVLGLSKNKVPMIGYTMMFPVALILKILYVQLLYILLT